MSLDWPKLFSQGRAKDIGVAWDEHEQEALTALIAHTGLLRPDVAPYVREGILTVEDYEAAKGKEAKAGKATDHKTRKELEKDATELGVSFTDDMTDSALAKLVKKAAEEAANAPAGPTREELETKATALGITFTAGTKDATLITKIGAAEEAAKGGDND